MKKTTHKSTQLTERAVLVRLHMGTWSGSLVDREATSELLRKKSAITGAAHVRKNIINKEELRGISSLTVEARNYHYHATLPWEESYRLLPIKHYEAYQKKMESIFREREGKVEKFLRRYHAAIEKARVELGSLFRESDYPTKAAIRYDFKADYRFTPVPNADHFVADLAKEEAEKIRQQIEENVQAKMTAASMDVYKRLGTLIDSILDKIDPQEDGKIKRLHHTVIANLKALCDMIPTLNVADDPALNALADEIRNQVMVGVTADDIRPSSGDFNETTHDNVVSDLRDIQKRFAGYFGTPDKGGQ